MSAHALRNSSEDFLTRRTRNNPILILLAKRGVETDFFVLAFVLTIGSCTLTKCNWPRISPFPGAYDQLDRSPDFEFGGCGFEFLLRRPNASTVRNPAHRPGFFVAFVLAFALRLPSVISLRELFWRICKHVLYHRIAVAAVSSSVNSCDLGSRAMIRSLSNGR